MVRVVPIGHAEPRRDFLGHAGRRIWCVAASPDGARLATASDDRTVKLWSLKPAKGILADEQPVPLRAVRSLPDGRTLLATRGDGALQRWRITSEDDLPRSSSPLPRRRLSLPQSPTADSVHSGGSWRIAHSIVLGGASPAAQGSGGDAESARVARDTVISPDCRLAAVCHYDSAAIALIDAATGRVLGELAPPADTSNSNLRAMSFSPAGEWLAESAGSSIRLWNVATRRMERQIQAALGVHALGFSADGARLAVAATDRLELWDVASGSLLREWQAHRSVIYDVLFSPTGSLASAGQDHLVRVWNGATGEAVAAFPGHSNAVEALAFSPDGRLLASGSIDGLVKLWSLETHQEVATLPGFPGAIAGVSFSPTHLILAATGGTVDRRGYLRLWCASPDATWQPLAP